MEIYRILVVDDDAEFLEIFARTAELEGRGGNEERRYKILKATSAEEALNVLSATAVDAVLSDILMPGKMDGYDLFKEVGRTRPGLPVILMTAYGSIEKAVCAVKEGAYHYFQKPIKLQRDDFWQVLDLAVQKHRLDDEIRRKIAEPDDGEAIIGRTPAMGQVIESINRVAVTPASVLITGDTGTGKELIALTIHRLSGIGLSGPKARPFVAINSAALTDSLLESELFGHTKGAFTGALADRPGIFERADGGTLFLDEVADLGVKAQSELLRVLDTKTYTPVGGHREKQTRFRLICATNTNLEKKVQADEFRRDLFYRLNVYPILLPPLKERREDLPALVAHFLVVCARKMSLPVKALSNEAMIFFYQYDWPGNVRELRNLLERGIIAATADQIGLGDLFPGIDDAEGIEPVTSLKQMERLMITLALARCKNNKTAAAAQLGIGVKTLYQKMKRYDL